MYFFTFVLLCDSAFSSAVSFVLTQMVRDKETKMRETLKIMSMSRGAYMFSYFQAQGFFALFTSICLCLAFYVPIRVWQMNGHVSYLDGLVL